MGLDDDIGGWDKRTALGPKRDYSAKTKNLEEKCDEESPVMSYFKFITYPVLGNMPSYMQEKLKDYYGEDAYNPEDASKTSAGINACIYVAGILTMWNYQPFSADMMGLITLVTGFGNVYIETAMRCVIAKQEGGCGSIIGKILFSIPEVIMRKIDHTRKKKRKELERLAEKEKNKPTKLEIFRRIIDQKQDEITPTLESIASISKKLLYEHNQEGVAKEILNLYKPYIEAYLEKAGEHVKDYRSALTYLESFDVEKIKKDVQTYEERIKQGKKSYEKVLQEKQDTLKNINDIKENREEIESNLCLAEATLQSLSGSIMSMETGGNKEKAMKEIQVTVSTLSKAIDKNFRKKGEEVVKEEVNY